MLRAVSPSALRPSDAVRQADASLDPEKVAAFSRLMGDVLENRDNPTRTAYLCTLLGAVELGPEKVRIVAAATFFVPQPPEKLRQVR